MRKMIWRSLAFSAAVLVAQLMLTTVTAQTRVMRVDVPFAFVASETVLPAGMYYVAYDAVSHKLAMTANEGPHMAFLMPATTAFGSAQTENPKLLFHKYGGEYFLREVVSSVGSVTWTMGPAKAEKTRLKNVGFEVAELRAQR